MTDSNFIRRVSKASHIPQTQIRKILDAVEWELKKELVKGEQKRVKVLDLTIYPKIQKPRPVRNPKTGEEFTLRPDRTIKVNLSTDWKEIFKDYKEYSKIE